MEILKFLNMKKVLTIVLLVMISLSCQKISQYDILNSKNTLSKDAIDNLNNLLKLSPDILNLVDEKNRKVYKIDLKSRKLINTKTWSFSDPDVNTVYAENDYIVVYASIDFLQENAQSYNIQVGDESLSVKTICMSIDYSSFLTLFGELGSEFPSDGFSAVIGIDADLSMLSNASSENIGNFFHGMASYYVYDFEASGQYEVFDWWDLNTFESGNAVAYAFLFSNNNFGSFHFSKDGNINVSGGNMTFEGNYYKIDYDFFMINDSLEFQTVQGSGTMGCI